MPRDGSLNLHIRPPLAHEWQICRMLLPETFADVSGREYLLCLRGDAPRIVAAASFRRVQDAITHLRIHVVSSFRRRRVGSQLVAYIARSGAHMLEGTADITRESAAEAFCERNRFERAQFLTIAEAEIEEMREYAGRLRSRLTVPAEARVTQLALAPVEEVANLHARYVAQEGELNPWRFVMGNASSLAHSPIVIVNGRVAGILLWERAEGTAVVHSRVVAPDYQGSWVNSILLAEGLDGAWASGARRVRFSYTDSNRDTRKLAARFKATTASVVAQFRRQVAA